MPTRRSDAELVEATRGGSEEAFGELLARYQDAVFGVAFHRVGDFEEARDIVQEVFVKAYLGLGALRDPSAFAPWLYRIADGTATDAARRPRREQPFTGDEVAPDQSHEAEVAREVRELISRLSEPTRLAVVLHYVDGYSHAEVAQFLGTTPQAVKTRLSRARSQLREEMADMAGERIKKAAQRGEPRNYEYTARSADGKEITGTSVAASEKVLVRRLRGKGYFIQNIRQVVGAPAPPRDLTEEQRSEPIRRIVGVILEQAARDGATVARAELRGPFPVEPGQNPRSSMCVLYLIGGTWHEVMSMPHFIWEPIQARLAEMAGDAGEFRFEVEGREHRAQATFGTAEIRLELAGPPPSETPREGPSASLTAEAAP